MAKRERKKEDIISLKATKFINFIDMCKCSKRDSSAFKRKNTTLP
jgi:hypothetical protein